MKLRKVLRWALLLAGCVIVAAVLALWWLRKADLRYQAHLREAQIPELQRLARQREWDPEIFYWLGVRLGLEGHHLEAVNALLRSVAMNPDSANARAALGLAMARADRPTEAETQLKQAITLDPKLQVAYFTLGNLYGKYKRWEQAADQLKKAVELNPNDLEAQYLLAYCYGEMFQEDRKMEILERLVKRAPDDIRILKSLGYVYLFFGKFPEAEAIYRHVLQLAPQDLETHYLLGRALADRANSPAVFAEAERELNLVVAKKADNPGVHLALGILHFQRNEPAQAVPELERAIKLGIREHKTWLYLGQAYARVGRDADSKRTLAEFQRGQRISQTVSQLENRLQNTPDDTPERRREKTEVRLRLVRVYMEDRDYPRAQNQLHILLDRDAYNREGLTLMRECQTRIKALQAAAPRSQSPEETTQ